MTAVFCCNVDALSAAERAEHRTLASQVAASIVGTRELPDGYAFELDDRVTTKALAAWIEFERRCCPFFDIAVEWRRDMGPATLRLTGADGIKDFIRAELPTIGR